MITRNHLLGAENRIAIFSDCERYRYLLEIIWDKDKPVCQFIGLNPSTATEQKDDPTLRKCKGFAHRWGFGGILMTNLFAFRATDPLEMKRASEPSGDPENLTTLIRCSTRKACLYAGPTWRVVAAWGCHGAFHNRGHLVRSFILNQSVPLKCLRRTNGGHPEHPLYLPYTVVPIPFN